MRSAAWILIPLLLAAFPAAAADPLPEGCSREGERFIFCRWTPTLGVTTSPTWTTSLSGLPEAILDISALPSVPEAWDMSILDVTDQTVLMAATEVGPYAGVHHIAFLPGHEIEMRLNKPVEQATIPRLVPTTYEITFRVETVHGSVRPSASAGGPGDPQLIDARGDARTPRELDIAGAWFDDPLVDDGLFEVGVLLPGLSNLRVEPHARARVDVMWTLLGDVYGITFVHLPEDSLFRGASVNNFGSWDGQLQKNGAVVLFLQPTADAAAGTLRAPVPIRSVGDPAAGVLFHNFSAASFYGPPTGYFSPGTLLSASPLAPPPVDEADQVVRPFALGGPEVWTQLRGLTPLTVAPAAAPWYRDPFSTDNLPDTLQVGGAALAGLTALWGLFVVRRRREALARLLDDVDAVLEVHGADREAALGALRRLQERFDLLLRKGTISESQHATLQARVEGAIGRLILQRVG